MTLGEMPVEPARPPAVRATQRPVRPGLGLAIGPVHPAILQRMPSIQGGVMVTGIDPEGQSAQAGLERGDVIVDINGRPVLEPTGFERAQSSLRDGQVVRFRVIRDGRPLYFALEYQR
jgi:S1-C subfamily serine protease